MASDIGASFKISFSSYQVYVVQVSPSNALLCVLENMIDEIMPQLNRQTCVLHAGSMVKVRKLVTDFGHPLLIAEYLDEVHVIVSQIPEEEIDRLTSKDENGENRNDFKVLETSVLALTPLSQIPNSNHEMLTLDLLNCRQRLDQTQIKLEAAEIENKGIFAHVSALLKENESLRRNSSLAATSNLSAPPLTDIEIADAQNTRTKSGATLNSNFDGSSPSNASSSSPLSIQHVESQKQPSSTAIDVLDEPLIPIVSSLSSSPPISSVANTSPLTENAHPEPQVKSSDKHPEDNMDDDDDGFDSDGYLNYYPMSEDEVYDMDTYWMWCKQVDDLDPMDVEDVLHVVYAFKRFDVFKYLIRTRMHDSFELLGEFAVKWVKVLTKSGDRRGLQQLQHLLMLPPSEPVVAKKVDGLVGWFASPHSASSSRKQPKKHGKKGKKKK